MQSLVLFGAESVAKRVAEDGVGFDVGRAGWWGRVRI